MKLALLIALALSPLASQDSEQWTAIGMRQGSRGQVKIEIAPLSIRAEAKLRHFHMRATSMFSGRIVISNVVVDCVAKQYWAEGEMTLYVDGKVAGSLTVNGDEAAPHPGDDEPVSTAMINLVCAK